MLKIWSMVCLPLYSILSGFLILTTKQKQKQQQEANADAAAGNKRKKVTAAQLRVQKGMCIEYWSLIAG